MQLEIVKPDLEEVAIALDKAIVPFEYPLEELLDTETQTYTREIFVPKGHLIIGKKHKTSCINILAKGKMLVKSCLEDLGKEIAADKTTVTFMTQAGAQKIGYAIEDCIFINVFSNVQATKLEDVETELIIPSEKLDKYLEEKELKWLG